MIGYITIRPQLLQSPRWMHSIASVFQQAQGLGLTLWKRGRFRCTMSPLSPALCQSIGYKGLAWPFFHHSLWAGLIKDSGQADPELPQCPLHSYMPAVNEGDLSQWPVASWAGIPSPVPSSPEDLRGCSASLHRPQ